MKFSIKKHIVFHLQLTQQWYWRTQIAPKWKKQKMKIKKKKIIWKVKGITYLTIKYLLKLLSYLITYWPFFFLKTAKPQNKHQNQTCNLYADNQVSLSYTGGSFDTAAAAIQNKLLPVVRSNKCLQWDALKNQNSWHYR